MTFMIYAVRQTMTFLWNYICISILWILIHVVIPYTKDCMIYTSYEIPALLQVYTYVHYGHT